MKSSGNALAFASMLALLASALGAPPALAQDNPTELSVGDAAKLIRAGKLKSETLVQALLARVDAGKDYNVFIGFDREAALKAARESDALAAKRQFKGPLHGVPIVIKDNIHVVGFTNTAGTPALKNFRPEANAPVMQRLLDAGAIVLGKTNMHELAFGITSNNAAFGPVRNAYDRSRIAGGSSGGTGTAVALRMAPGGLGTDTGGSVRQPAALNGIVGFRPTIKRYSQEGITPLSSTRDTAGPMARTVADVILLDGVITRGPQQLAPARLKGVRLGIERKYFWNTLDAQTKEQSERALDALKREGVVLVDVEIPNLGPLVQRAGFTISLYEARVTLTDYLKTYKTGIALADVVAQIASPDVKTPFQDVVLPGGKNEIKEDAYRLAMAVDRPALQKLYADVFAKNRIDALIAPTTILPAAPIGDDATTTLNGAKVPTFPSFVRVTSPGTNVGVPSLSLPIGRTSEGLPLGMQIDGPVGSDQRLLSIGLAMERVFGHLPPPQVTVAAH